MLRLLGGSASSCSILSLCTSPVCSSNARSRCKTRRHPDWTPYVHNRRMSPTVLYQICAQYLLVAADGDSDSDPTATPGRSVFVFFVRSSHSSFIHTIYASVSSSSLAFVPFTSLSSVPSLLSHPHYICCLIHSTPPRFPPLVHSQHVPLAH